MIGIATNKAGASSVGCQTATASRRGKVFRGMSPISEDHGGMFARCAAGALPFYELSRLQPEIYPLMEKAPQMDHDGLRTFPTKHVG